MAKHVSSTSSMELAHYATILRRRWIYVAGALVLGLLLSTALMVVTPSRSTATTLVNINLISSNAFAGSRPPSDLLDMETEQAMARSTSVMNEVAGELDDGWTKASVRSATEATLLPDGTVLRIRFTGGSAREAAAGATLVADKYLAYRSEEAQGRVDDASESLAVRRDSLRKQLNAANSDFAESPAGSPGQLAAELSRQQIAEELSSVTTQLNELRAVNTSGGAVLTEADPQQTQTSPNRPLMLFSGLLGGLLTGLVLAFVVNVLDRRVRDEYDVSGAGGGVTVARLMGEAVAVPATAVEAEQIRAVRERVMAAMPHARPVVAVIDVGPDGSMPTDLAANLAISVADSGLTTEMVVVDHPVDVLVEVLHALRAREVGVERHVRRFRSALVPSLTIAVPETEGTRLATIDVVAELLTDASRTVGATVVAISPTAGSAARLAAGRFADQVLFAVHEKATLIDEVAAVAGELLAVEARIHGTVLLREGRNLTAQPGSLGTTSFRPSAASTASSATVFAGGAVSGARGASSDERAEDAGSMEALGFARADPHFVEPAAFDVDQVDDNEQVDPATADAVQSDSPAGEPPVARSSWLTDSNPRDEFFDQSVHEDEPEPEPAEDLWPDNVFLPQPEVEVETQPEAEFESDPEIRPESDPAPEPADEDADEDADEGAAEFGAEPESDARPDDRVPEEPEAEAPEADEPQVDEPQAGAPESDDSPAAGDDPSTDRPETDPSSAPGKSAPGNSVPDASAPDNSAPDNSAPDNSAPDNSAPDRPDVGLAPPARLAAQFKKKRGRGRKPTSAARTSGSTAGPSQVDRSDSDPVSREPGPVSRVPADAPTRGSDAPAADSHEGAGPTSGSVEGGPEIPANENSWAFTR